MRFTYLILFLMIAVGFYSCVSTKQLTYLQDDPIKMDTLISIRKMQEPYRLQINDLLSIRVKALDPELVDILILLEKPIPMPQESSDYIMTALWWTLMGMLEFLS